MNFPKLFQSRATLFQEALSGVLLVLALSGCSPVEAEAEAEAAGELASEEQRIVQALKLRPGMRVADVGAGDGEWSLELARQVGDDGHVYATEVDEDDFEDLRQLFEDEEVDNVTSILGDDLDTGLPDDCCDAILLRLVYHHFTEPEPMRASLRRALRPGGVIAVIDLVPQEDWRELPGVPDRGGHGIPRSDLIAEMTGDGFEIVTQEEDWPGDEDRYCVVFRRSVGGEHAAP